MTAPTIPPTVRTSGQFRDTEYGERDAKRVNKFLSTLEGAYTAAERTPIIVAYLEYMKATP